MVELTSKVVVEAPAARPDGGEPATAALNLAWAEAFVAALEERGVKDACICAGSRSAPLVLAFHRSSIRTHVPLDERAGAFFALGLAKASRRPVAIVTTSGTGAANLHPAAIEAYHSRVPLILLTADRPPELRDTGAPQTIDQLRLFGTAVRWFHEVGVPAPDPKLSHYAASLGTRAVAESWGPPAGPVHLNFAFREPLVPEPESLTPPPARRRSTSASALAAGAPEPEPPSAQSVERAARLIAAKRRGLIVCGPEDASPEFAPAVARLAAVTGYPILADPASQVRYGPHDRTRVMGAYDAFLRSPAFTTRQAPEVIIQFGPVLTSKAYHLYRARHPEALQILVDPARGFRDPSRRASEVFASDQALFADALAQALENAADPLPGWGEIFSGAERTAHRVIEGLRAAVRGNSEGTIFPDLIDAVPEGAILYVGNSLPIRHLDLFAPTSPKQLRVLANRGANGIDGLVSSGLGAGAASDAPVLVVTGDLSFHHDLNGLAAVREGVARATIVVVNNDGGGVFSLLPIARHGEAFERYFATPHGFDFEPAAAIYGIPFARPGSAADLRSVAAASLNQRRTQILEVRCDREETRSLHQTLRADVIRAMEDRA